MTVSKLIAGFLLGVVVTLAVVFWLDGKSPEMQDSLTNQSSLPEETAELERSNTAKRIDEAAEGEDEDPDTSTFAESVSDSELSALQNESFSTPQPVATAMSPAPKPPARTTSGDYPPEIADMIEGHVDKELQARYESDEREESWATYMEGQLAAYFARKPELAQFNFSLIDCRTSICEIHALGYGPDALTFWNTGTADIVTQTWHDFQSMSVNRRNPQPDILGIVLILSRKPPE